METVPRQQCQSKRSDAGLAAWRHTESGTTAATVIPGTDINITIDGFPIVHPTTVGTIAAALNITDTITGTMMID
jgi:hypothetical protein